MGDGPGLDAEDAGWAAGGGQRKLSVHRVGLGVKRRGSMFLIHSDDESDEDTKEMGAEEKKPVESPPKLEPNGENSGETSAEKSAEGSRIDGAPSKAVEQVLAGPADPAKAVLPATTEAGDGHEYDIPGAPVRKTILGFIELAYKEKDCSAIIAAARMRQSDPFVILFAIKTIGKMSTCAGEEWIADLANTGCTAFICDAIEAHKVKVLEDSSALLWSLAVLADNGAKSASEFTSGLAKVCSPVIMDVVAGIVGEDADTAPPSLHWGLGILSYFSKQINPQSLKEISGSGMFDIVCDALKKFGSKNPKIAQWGIGILSCFPKERLNAEVMGLIKQVGLAHHGRPSISSMVQLALNGAESLTKSSDDPNNPNSREEATEGTKPAQKISTRSGGGTGDNHRDTSTLETLPTTAPIEQQQSDY
eukprot:g766.t1